MRVTLHNADTVARELWQRWGRCAAESRGGKPENYERIAKDCLVRHHLAQSRMVFFDFRLEDISRICTHQIVRHSQGVVIGQASMRGSNDDSDQERYGLPMGTLTSMQISMNIEALIHFAHERLCSRASREIREVAQCMRELAVAAVPELAPHLVPKCKWLGRCLEADPCS